MSDVPNPGVAFMASFVWSSSALDMYENCPYQFYRVRVVRDVKKDYGEAAIKGDRIHKALEAAVRDGTPMPESMPTYQTLADDIRSMPGTKLVEHRMCMSRELTPVEWTGVWSFGPGAWGVGIADVLVYDSVNTPDQAVIIDHKTGKYRGFTHQAPRLAACVMANYDVAKVTCLFNYVEEGKVAPYVYTIDQLDAMLEHTDNLLADMHHSAVNNAWPRKQSGLCGFCPVVDCHNNTSLQRRRFK